MLSDNCMVKHLPKSRKTNVHKQKPSKSWKIRSTWCSLSLIFPFACHFSFFSLSVSSYDFLKSSFDISLKNISIFTLYKSSLNSMDWYNFTVVIVENMNIYYCNSYLLSSHAVCFYSYLKVHINDLLRKRNIDFL